jgi:hypothetical protein
MSNGAFATCFPKDGYWKLRIQGRLAAEVETIQWPNGWKTDWKVHDL